jgi:hypothetical protein
MTNPEAQYDSLHRRLDEVEKMGGLQHVNGAHWEDDAAVKLLTWRGVLTPRATAGTLVNPLPKRRTR